MGGCGGGGGGVKKRDVWPVSGIVRARPKRGSKQ